MDYGKILVRAFEITRKYRALWLFGFLMALFGGTGGGNNFNFNLGNQSGLPKFESDAFPILPAEVWRNLPILVALGVCLVLTLVVLGVVVRMVSRGALIGLAQELEAGGTPPSVRRGFSIGANRFWQLLGIGLVINLPLALFSLAVMLVAIAPILLTVAPALSAHPGSTEFTGTMAGGIIGSIALICCAALCLIVVTFVVKPFYEFIVRVCVIDRRGVVDSMRGGYRMVRANLGNVVVLYALLIGVSMAFGIVMIPVALILIGIPIGAAFAVGFMAHSAGLAMLIGLLIGIPLVLVLIFIHGLYQVYEATVWTLGFLAIAKPPTAPSQLTT